MAKVLVVDDRSEDVKHIVEVLEKKGHEVVYYSYSQIAQKVISERSFLPDCAIYDLMLPRYQGETNTSAELGGLLLIRETKRKSPNTKVVLHTSGLDEKYLSQVGDTPVFIKSENKLEEMMKTLGL